MSALPLTFLASLSFTLNIWQSLSSPPGSPCIRASAAVQRHFSQGTMGHQLVVSSIVRSKPASCAQISSADSINRAKSARGLVSVKSHTEIGPSSIAHWTMITSTVWAYLAFPNLKLGPRVSVSINSFKIRLYECLRDLRHDCIAVAPQESHSIGYPMSQRECAG